MSAIAYLLERRTTVAAQRARPQRAAVTPPCRCSRRRPAIRVDRRAAVACASIGLAVVASGRTRADEHAERRRSGTAPAATRTAAAAVTGRRGERRRPPASGAAGRRSRRRSPNRCAVTGFTSGAGRAPARRSSPAARRRGRSRCRTSTAAGRRSGRRQPSPSADARAARSRRAELVHVAPGVGPHCGVMRCRRARRRRAAPVAYPLRPGRRDRPQSPETPTNSTARLDAWPRRATRTASDAGVGRAGSPRADGMAVEPEQLHGRTARRPECIDGCTGDEHASGGSRRRRPRTEQSEPRR